MASFRLDGAGSDKRKDVKLQEKNIGYALQALHTAAALGCKRFLIFRFPGRIRDL